MRPFIVVLTSSLRPYSAVAKQFVSLRVHPFALPTGLSVSSQCIICVYEGENRSGDLGAVSYRDLYPANAVYHQWVIVLLSRVPSVRCPHLLSLRPNLLPFVLSSIFASSFFPVLGLLANSLLSVNRSLFTER